MDIIRWLKKLLTLPLSKTESPPKHEELPEKELWIIKYEHNLKKSPIYRLPNELILMVILRQ